MSAPRRLDAARLVVATHNAGKLAENAALLARRGIAAVGATELGLPEPAETEESFLGNAALKARAAALACGLPALADDSGFSVAALGGRPGVRTADWATRPDGTRDYAAAMARVAAEAAGAADRGARFTCALVLAWPDGHAEGFEGHAEGAWTWPPRGDAGFGFDPMFVPAGGSLTFGEMDPAAKRALSHRSRAFALLAASCLPPAPAGEG